MSATLPTQQPGSDPNDRAVARCHASISSVALEELPRAVREFEALGIDAFHVDIADGEFTPDLHGSAAVIAAVRTLTRLPIEAHLMVTSPGRSIRAVHAAGATRVIFHAESTRYPLREIGLARRLGLGVGIAVNPATPLHGYGYLSGLLDAVSILTTEPDDNGELFLDGLTPKIATAREALGNPDVVLQLDGGLGSDQIESVRSLGIDEFVVGRALRLAADPAQLVRRIHAVPAARQHPDRPVRI